MTQHECAPRDRDGAVDAERRIWLRNADRLEAQGLRKLERGHYHAASSLLQDAVRIYEEYGYEDGIFSASQYLGVALYELGEVDRAARLWEGLLSRGWSGPTVLGLLVRHYSERGEREEVDRLTGQFREFSAERDPTPRPERGARSEDPLIPARASDSGTHILVVDNDDEIREVLARLLRMDGHKITEAADGEEALNAVLVDPPDLVFLDIYIPKRSGLDVLYRMRQAGLQTPTIVISGMADASMVRDAVLLGAEFMQKPVFLDELRDCIEEQIGGVTTGTVGECP